MDLRRVHRISRIALAILSLYFLVSGVAGVVVGGTSAQAGWWLVVVGIIGLVITARDLPGR
jgi:uncharacterized membrane protein HdeD (DUF308 family)